MTVFYSVEAALKAGYALYDRIPDGYLARTCTSQGFALAIVDLTKKNLDKNHLREDSP